jgi:hypothetical protein
MGWMQLLFFMTLAESVAAYFIYVTYHYTFFPDFSPASIARLVLALVPANAALIFLVNRLADMAGGFFLSPGRKGKNLYSRERAMAVNGDREEACARLAKAASRRGGLEALRLLIEIATQEPRQQLWIARAAGLKNKIRGLSREDHAGLDMMLGRMKRVEKKEEPAF